MKLIALKNASEVSEAFVSGKETRPPCTRNKLEIRHYMVKLVLASQ